MEIIDQKLIEEVTRKIVERFAPRRIVLFGSHARGNAGPDSDLDLFIEMESDLKPPQRAIAISSIFGLRTWSMDIIVYTPQEVLQCRNKLGSILRSIETEGKVLYERN